VSAVAERAEPRSGASFWQCSEQIQALAATKPLAVTSRRLHGAWPASLLKIANDIRCWAGPALRASANWCCENEAGLPKHQCRARSIPTQCESLTMVAIQVMANTQPW